MIALKNESEFKRNSTESMIRKDTDEYTLHVEAGPYGTGTVRC